MSAKRFPVELSAEVRPAVERVARSHRRSARERQHARILLRSADGATDEAIAVELRTCVATVRRVRQHCGEEGWKAAVFRRPQARHKPRVLDGAGEAQLVALACGAPPDGQQRWSLVLLQQRLIELHVVDAISKETVRQTLKKTHSSRG